MSPHPRSIRRGLTLRVVLPLLALLAVGLWISLNGAWQQASLVTDRLLTGSARVIAEDLYYADGRISAEIPPAALEMFASESRDRVVYRVIGPGGALIGGYGDLQSPPSHTDQQPVAYDTVFRAEQMRAVAFPQQVATPSGLALVTVVVAETVRARTQLFSTLIFGQIGQQIGLVVLAAAFIWFGIGWELRPLLGLANTVQRRRPDDFSPIPTEPVQSELHPLVSALNGFMNRLERTVTRQRDFLDIAAHQLRTPLAVLKTQVSFALRSPTGDAKDETLRAVDDDLNAMSRLTNQLLVLGRSEHDPHSVTLHPVDLSAASLTVVASAAPRALDARLELALDAPTPAFITADADLVTELLSNLIDNAILYAGRGATAVISTRVAAGNVTLKVTDTGPGVPASDRERILRRFERGSDATGIGSGLGLAIVAELTEMFGGKLVLEEPAGSGFVAVMTFPAAVQSA
jgi:two-component system sensor histidine kinase TctE